MRRNVNIELYRCLCMFGVVCIHVFSGAKPITAKFWALSCPFLVGFMMISGWFGIHFALQKLLRLLGVVFVCSTIGMFIGGEFSWGGGVYGKDYWYVWAYIFTMILSPIIDDYVESCDNRNKLVKVFVSVGIMLWGWSYLALRFPAYVPVVRGFGHISGVTLFLIYILARLIRRLKFAEWFQDRLWLVIITFVISALMIAFKGFWCNNSIFSFLYAFSVFILINRIKVGEVLGKVIVFIAPSMFSVYLLHMPAMKYLTSWCSTIENLTDFPHPVCQFFIAIGIFLSCIGIDMPRRAVVHIVTRWVSQHERVCANFRFSHR